MPTPVELVPYRAEYRDKLVDLWRASFERGVGRPAPNSVADHRRFFDEHMLTETHVHLALRDGMLVGFGAFTPDSVVQLYVHVDHLGQGIGTPPTLGSRRISAPMIRCSPRSLACS